MFKIMESGNPSHHVKVKVLTKPDLNAVVSFYRSSFQAKGKFGSNDTAYNGEYGFDRFEEKIMADGLFYEYEELRGVEMQKETIDGNHSYLCPYINIWPPGVEGNSSDSKSIVTIYFRLEKSKAFSSGDPDHGPITIKSSDPKNIEIKGADKNGELTLSLKVREKNDPQLETLTLRCLRSFNSKTYILARTSKGNVIGQIIVLPNAVRYKTVLQPVRLQFSPSNGKTIVKESNNSFFTSLLDAFNNNSFNQALIFAELAAQTEVVTLSYAQFYNYLKKEVDGKKYLKMVNDSDSTTVAYNNLVEDRYAALLANQSSKNSAEEELKEKTKAFLYAFDLKYSFTRSSQRYTKKQYTKKIVTNAWKDQMVQDAYAEFEIAEKNFKDGGGEANPLDKKHKIHLFFSHEIHAARNPISKVLAYSSLNSGVAHIFDTTFRSGKIAYPTVIHEIGHSLGLEHTFDKSLGKHEMRKTGKEYKEDFEAEIVSVENKLLRQRDRRNRIEKLKRDLLKKRTSIDEDQGLNTLRNWYRHIEKELLKKDSRAEDPSYIKDWFKDWIDSIIELEKNPLTSNSIKSIADLDSELLKLDAEITKLEGERLALEQKVKTADSLKTLSKAQNQSDTLENYMDYNQNSLAETNRFTKRMLFYKWQWDEIRQVGANKGYLEEKKT